MRVVEPVADVKVMERESTVNRFDCGAGPRDETRVNIAAEVRTFLAQHISEFKCDLSASASDVEDTAFRAQTAKKSQEYPVFGRGGFEAPQRPNFPAKMQRR